MECFAGIELGGTTCVAAVSDVHNPTMIINRRECATICDPVATINNLIGYLREFMDKHNVACFKAIGIATFGPVDLHRNSQTYGHILNTPKKGWSNYNIVCPFTKAFPDVPIYLDTDVNAPAIAEAFTSDVAEDRNVVYVTVGTGVGVGLSIRSVPLYGMLHPEAGHMTCSAMPGDDYVGSCPFHGNCIEGMVNSAALAARAGVQPSQLHSLPDSHQVWEIAGFYLAQLCVNLTYTVSPDLIVIGGGIMKRLVLFEICRRYFKKLNAGYLVMDELKTEERLCKYIQKSTFGNDAGIVGALMLPCQHNAVH